MNKISAAMVKELRERTGSGVMDCKKALVETNGNLERAVMFLRKKGLFAAARKTGRSTSEGLVNAYVTVDKTIGVLVDVCCETDFVAKNPAFKRFVHDFSIFIAEQNPQGLNDIGGHRFSDGETVEVRLKTLINAFGENILIKRFERFHKKGLGEVEAYIHDDYLTEGKIGVLIETAVNRMETLSTPEYSLFLRSLLQHITASGPNNNDVQDLLDQSFIKEPNKTVGELLKNLNDHLEGELISILHFTRFEKGES